MLRSVKSMQGYQVNTLNGNSIGTVYDFYFDDHDWSICYLVVESGATRKALISPEGLMQPNWTDKSLTVNLTQDQIANSPDIDTEQPLSRQKEAELRRYYGWPPVLGTEETEMGERGNDLRSVKAVLDYQVQARDGDAGHAEDFLIDDESWTVQYLVVDIRNWLPGRNVLVSPSWIAQIDWAESLIQVDLSQETIKNSPEYDLAEQSEQEFEEKVYDRQN